MITKKLSPVRGLLILLILLSIVISGCMKTELTDQEQNSFNENLFFRNIENANPNAQKLANELKNRNQTQDYLRQFALKYGYPIWDKSKIFPAKYTGQSSNFSKEGDSVIIVPVLHPEIKEVRTYVEASIKDFTILAVHTANEYQKLKFGADEKGTIGEAERHAIRFMTLNMDVFNYTTYNISDKRLFHGSGDSKDTPNIKRIINLYKKEEPSSANFTGTATSNFYFHQICVDIITTTYTSFHCPYSAGNCNGPGGTCDGCLDVCASGSVSTQSICESWWDEGSGGSGGDPGGTTTGGTSGGGGTPGSTTCTGAGTLPINGKEMPCGNNEPGGWTPVVPSYSPTVIFLGTILSLQANEKDWLSQNHSVALGIQQFLTESLNDEDPNTLLPYMDIFPPEAISAAKATIHASMLNLIEGPYDQEHFEAIKSDLPSPLNTNSFDPNFWLHFRISCAFIKLENPDWPNWKVYIHAMKETTHLMLDLAGLVPGWGEIADITNGVIYAIEGDGVNASLSFAAAIPIAGWASTATKLARKTVIALDGSRRSLKWAKNANGIINFGDRGLLRKVLGLASGDPRIAHHMIPWEHGGKDLIQKAASGPDPFHLNELLNGIPLTSLQHIGGHALYNEKVGSKLQQLWQASGGANMSTETAQSLVRSLANDIRDWIVSHPSESINNIIIP